MKYMNALKIFKAIKIMFTNRRMRHINLSVNKMPSSDTLHILHLFLIGVLNWLRNKLMCPLLMTDVSSLKSFSLFWTVREKWIFWEKRLPRRLRLELFCKIKVWKISKLCNTFNNYNLRWVWYFAIMYGCALFSINGKCGHSVPLKNTSTNHINIALLSLWFNSNWLKDAKRYSSIVYCVYP